MEPLEWYEKDFPAFVAKVLGMEQADYEALRARSDALAGLPEEQVRRDLLVYGRTAFRLRDGHVAHIGGPAVQAHHDLLLHRGDGQPALAVDFRGPARGFIWVDSPMDPDNKEALARAVSLLRLEGQQPRQFLDIQYKPLPRDPDIKYPNRAARRRADKRHR